MSSGQLFIKLNKSKTAPNLTTLIHHALELAEKHTNLTGREKKQFSLSMIKETIELLPDDKHKTILLENYETGNISDLIDLIIDVSKGKINLNKKISFLLKCVLSCLNSKTEPK